MANPLISKLETTGFLIEEDRQTLENLCEKTRRASADKDLTNEGDRPDDVLLVLEGFACRYKLMPEGRRQIVALLVPGDFCDLHVAILGEMDHAIMTITPCTMVEIPRASILDLTYHHPRVTQALWWATLVDEGILREWLASAGQRDAGKRMAHLFCELLVRLRQVGLADENSFAFPVTQIELGDILGITSVHVNRTLQELRTADLVDLTKRRVVIPDVQRLTAYCSFDPNYLHLTPRTKTA